VLGCHGLLVGKTAFAGVFADPDALPVLVESLDVIPERVGEERGSGSDDHNI
jgi:hypothetical protein